MGLPSPTQWERFSALRERFEPLTPAERQAQLRALRADSGDDARVISLIALHFAMPVTDGEKGLGPGDRIDDVTLGEPLGTGGMGVVHEAVQKLGAGGRPVAVKLINPLLWRMAPDEARRRFFDEINAQAMLQYDGLARLYEAGTYTDPTSGEQAPYLVMELVGGARPITRFAAEQRLGLDERLALFRRVCRALQHAHDHRIIHRDLKPANILVDSEGRPFVVDFGLAQTCDAVLPGAMLVASGTPAYMSPEQLSDQFGPVSEKTDTYAMGVVLYELLTGKPPYEVTVKDSLEHLREVVTTIPPPSIGEHNASLAGELEQIIATALSKAPSERMTVGALGSQLTRFLMRRAPSKQLATAAEPGRRWPPILIAALSLLALSLAVTVVVLNMTGSPVPIALEGNTPQSSAITRPAVSLVVRPFEDVSMTGDEAALAETFTRAISNVLIPVDDLIVLDNESLAELRGISTRDVGEKLEVEFVLRGQVERSGDSVSVSIELVDTTSGAIRWASSYNRLLGNLNLVVRQVAAAVAHELRLKFDIEQPSGTASAYDTNSIGALKAVLATYDIDDMKPEGWSRRVRLLESATRQDPEYAYAWLGLALSHWTGRWLVGQGYPWFERATSALQKAEALAPHWPLVHLSKAEIYIDAGDWHEAQRALKHAAELGGTQQLQFLQKQVALYLKAGFAQKALPLAVLAVRQSPLETWPYMFLGHTYAMLGRLDEALQALEEGLETTQGYMNVMDGLIVALSTRNQPHIDAWLPRAVEYNRAGRNGYFYLAMQERLHDTPSAVRWLREAFEDDSTDPYAVIIWSAYHRDEGLTLNALRANPDPWIMWMPLLEEVRRRPEFASLVRDAGLVEFWDEFGWPRFCELDDSNQLQCR